MKLSGKVALVTGTSPNIGGGIAEGLAAEGALIVAIDALEANAVACAAAVEARGGTAIGIVCDVTCEEQVRSAIDRTLTRFGQIDVIVNNAATFNKKGLRHMSWTEWERQTSIILGGTFLFTKWGSEAMIAAGTTGVIVNIVSTAGHQGEPGNIAYSTAKGGLLNFTRSAAMELAQHNIRVVSLTPTATDPAEMLERAQRWGCELKVPAGMTELIEHFRRRLPTQVLPRPSDYAKALVFLVSDDASMITGSDLRVDAGAVSKYWAWDPSDET